jgi:hypothetical protein
MLSTAVDNYTDKLTDLAHQKCVMKRRTIDQPHMLLSASAVNCLRLFNCDSLDRILLLVEASAKALNAAIVVTFPKSWISEVASQEQSCVTTTNEYGSHEQPAGEVAHTCED